MILGSIGGGAGGRGGACIIAEYADSGLMSCHALLPHVGCGEYLKASPLPPTPFSLLAGCGWLAAGTVVAVGGLTA